VLSSIIKQILTFFKLADAMNLDRCWSPFMKVPGEQKAKPAAGDFCVLMNMQLADRPEYDIG
jgi:hypothetical protein